MFPVIEKSVRALFVDGYTPVSTLAFKRVSYGHTLCGPSSSARHRVNASRAVLVQAYTPQFLVGFIPNILAILTIAPPFPLSIIPLAITCKNIENTR